ncbi:MAG: hypothetical protein U0704_05705 [Candidatus Eisenbacteria bacterium]
MNRYLGGLLDPFVTLLEVHKLMYFLQEAGEPLRPCVTRRRSYGPYAENLRHVLHAIEGHLIAGYDDDGDALDKPLTLVAWCGGGGRGIPRRASGDVERSTGSPRSSRASNRRSVSSCCRTVHWVMRNEPVRSLGDVAGAHLRMERTQSSSLCARSASRPMYWWPMAGGQAARGAAVGVSPTDTSERGLGRLICTVMTGGACDPGTVQPTTVRERPAAYGAGWICSSRPEDYDREYCVDLAQPDGVPARHAARLRRARAR